MQICIKLTKAPGFADEHTRDINPEWRATSPKNREATSDRAAGRGHLGSVGKIEPNEPAGRSIKRQVNDRLR
jgi:hypothetical protein